MTDLPPIPHVDAHCQTCGNPTLLCNVPSPIDGRLPMPNLPAYAVACCHEDCPAMYQPVDLA